MLTTPARPSRRRFGSAPVWAGGALILGGLFLLLRVTSSESASPEAAPAPSETAAPRRPAAQTPTDEGADDVARAPRRATPPKAQRPSAKEQAPPADDEPADEAPPDTDDPAVAAVRAAAADRSARGTQALIASLTSSDEVVVAEAANALVKRRATEAIAPLSNISLESAAGSGLSIIDALGRLGAVAGPDDRSVAVDRLLAMLADEKERSARESPGNLLQIYEALGLTRDPRAAAPLEAELLDDTVPRAPKVVIVDALVAIGQPSSRAALETAHAQQGAAKGADAFEEEIRVELVGAIAKALQSL